MNPILLPRDPRLIGPALRDIRIMLCMTQLYVIKNGGGQQNVISSFETGRTSPSFPTAIKYLNALGYQLAIVPTPEESCPAKEVDPKDPHDPAVTGDLDAQELAPNQFTDPALRTSPPNTPPSPTMDVL